MTQKENVSTHASSYSKQPLTGLMSLAAVSREEVIAGTTEAAWSGGNASAVVEARRAAAGV